MKKLITHNASFHTDDIFAASAISILLERAHEVYEIIRTRDEEIIKTGDYVFDVGGIYDEATNRFDHHQIGGAGKGPEGIEYSSFGLVWKKFGAELCGSKKSADIVEKTLVAPIDAHDNGFSLVEKKYDISPFLIQDIFFLMHPTWRELEGDYSHDEVFLKAVLLGKEILLRAITHANDAVTAEEKVLSIYQSTQDKRIIVLDKHYPSGDTLHNFPEPLYVIYPRETNNTWGVKAIQTAPKTFTNRKDFPASWGGLRDEELQKITGVSDAIFCHRALFMAVAKSKEGAIKLAQIAVES